MNISTAISKDPARRSLTAHDRCDVCGAQALVQVRLGAGDLMFCKHHQEKNAAALTKAGAAVVVDDREALAREEQRSSHAIK